MGIRTEPELEVVEPLSFDAFYRAEHDGQVRRAFLMLGSHADAADAVASAFTEVLQRWDTIETPGPYLNRCVLNACRHRGRKRSKLRLVADAREAEVADPVPSVGAAAELADVLLTLPYRQRAVIVLKHYAAMSEREIAEALEMAPGSVGPTLSRAHKKLKEALQ